MDVGAAQERAERMMMCDRDAHVAWVDVHAWQHPAAPRRRWRQTIAALLISLADRLGPTTAVTTATRREMA